MCSIKNAGRLLCIAAILCVLARPASAAVIDFTGTGLGVGGNTFTYNGSGLGTFFAGELNWSWTSGMPTGYTSSFYAYCVDIQHVLWDPETVAVGSTDFLTVSGVPNAGGKAAWLFNTYAASVHASGNATYGAALQIAIWESLYDTSANLSGGNLTVSTSSAVATQAMVYLNALYSGGAHTSVATWLDAPTNYGQDQMIAMPAPEPASIILCGSGCMLLAHSLRRWRRSASRSGSSVRPGGAAPMI